MTVDTQQPGAGAPIAGAVMAMFSIGAIIALSHHPVAHSSADLARMAGLDRVVHGAIIALMVLQTLALATLAARLDWARALVRSAFVLYFIAIGWAIGAMLIDGFIVADIGERFTDASAADAATVRVVMAFASSAIQVLTKLYLILASAGIFLFSLALFARGGVIRACAVLGLIVGLGASAPVLLPALSLNPHNLMALMGAQSLWFLFVAGLLLTRQL